MFKKTFHKIARHVWHSRWERFYSRSHWHLVLDLSLLIVIIMLAAGFIGLHVYRPNISWFGGPVGPAVDLNNPPLEIKFSTSDSSLGITEGSSLRINFRNNSAAVIANTTIDLMTVDNDFNLSRIEIVGGEGVKVNGRQIVLAPIKAGGSGEVDLKVYFTPGNPEARTINWEAQIAYNFAGQLLKSVKTLTPLTVRAFLTVFSDAYYTSPQGDQLGIGPLPPLVGIPTDYWVFWQVEGNGDFKDLVFSAYLPEGVSLAGGRSLLVGELNYNAVARQVVWKLPSLSGKTNYRLGFAVELLPTAKQVGQILPLLTKTRYYAVDALTGRSTSGQLDDLTTDLKSDQFNAGQGTVEKQ